MRDSFATYDLHRELKSPVNVQQGYAPKAWFEDPYAMMDSLGIGFKDAPTPITYETLRLMAERDSVISIIHATILGMVSNFCRRPKHKYDIGLKIKHKDKDPKEYTPAIRKRCKELEDFFLNTGWDKNYKRHNFTKFVKKIVSDRLTYDQVTVELIKTVGGKLHSFWHVPAYTTRLATPRSRKGTPPTLQQQLTEAQYVQIVDNIVVSAWTEPNFIWDVDSPRTTLIGQGYGFSKLEKLLLTITAHLWAEEWNRAAFDKGSSIKGVFNFKGNLSKEKLEDFRRQWLMQAMGVWNAHRQIFVNTDGMDFIPLNLNNGEMGYYQWLMYLIMIACAEYQIAPEVCGFDLRIGAGARGSGSAIINVNEENLQTSQDKFLRPLLHQLEDIFNSDKVMECLDPDFMFEWYGIDQSDEEKDMQLRIQELQNFTTLNEVREKEGLDPILDGDIPMNPVYTGYVMQKQMAEQQLQQDALGGQQGTQILSEPGYGEKPLLAPKQGFEQKEGVAFGDVPSQNKKLADVMQQMLKQRQSDKERQPQLNKSIKYLSGLDII